MSEHSSLPQHQLPPWMRRALRPTDWGAFLALAFSLLIALPMVVTPGLPRSNDNEHWVFQSDNYSRAFTEGRLYPRWSPHALGGYGAPIPHYYPPAPAYAAAALQTIIVGEALNSVRLVYIFALVMSALPVYAFAARYSDAKAGIISAVLYTSCPYIAFTTPHLLGDLPAALGHFLLPFALWAFDRLLSANQPFDVALAALGVAALILTDLRTLLLGTVFSTFLLLWHLRGKRRLPLFALVTSIALGVLLTAFFWMPALLEYRDVNWRTLTDAEAVPISVGSLFTPVTQLDPSQTNPAPQFTLGTVVPVFALGSLLTLFLNNRFGFAFVWLLAGGLSVTVTLGFAQPWWLSGAALGFSLSASAAVRMIDNLHLRIRSAVYALVMLVIMVSAISMWMTPRAVERTIDTSPGAQLQYELQGFGLAGLPRGWRLPTTLAVDLDYDPALLGSYTTGVVEKIDPQSIPPGTQVGFLAHDSHSDRFQVQSDFGGALPILTANFPGWTASGTSAVVALEPAQETNLLSLTFPDGVNSDISVFLGSTPARILGWAASAMALLALAAETRRRNAMMTDYLEDYVLLERGELRALSGVWLLAVAFATLATTGLIPGLQVSAGSGLFGSAPLRIPTDAGIEAISYRETRVQGDVELIIYFRALEPLQRNYRIQVSLIDPTTGGMLAQSPLRNPGEYPTRRWQASRYVSDRYWFRLPPEAEAAPVAARVEVYDCSELCTPDDRIRFFDSQGTPIGQVLTLPIGS